MTAPVNIKCPVCASTPGNYCTSATVDPKIRQRLTFHHAERIDAAFGPRRASAPADHDPVNEDTWLEFLPPGGKGYCGLCGNFGIFDTRGNVVSPRGQDCGVRAFCICPNGRTLKHEHGGELPPIVHSIPTVNEEI